MLVVCEGEYTEPRYFDALRNCLRLNTFVVVKAAKSDPRALVNMAKRENQRERRNGEQFDFVYCVFDRDSHEKFEEASDVARRAGFKLARSWPCFEFWLLLHFVYVRGSYTKSGSMSPCDACIRDLREHLPGYDKSDQTTFDNLWHQLDGAIENGYKAAADAEATGERNPSTEIHELVECLLALSEPALSAQLLGRMYPVGSTI